MREIVRNAKRVGVIAAAVTGLGGITIAVAKSLALESRVATLERHDREGYGHLARVDAKLDFIALQFGIKVPLQLQAPHAAPSRGEAP